jgi:hypothetical protein
MRGSWVQREPYSSFFWELSLKEKVLTMDFDTIKNALLLWPYFYLVFFARAMVQNVVFIRLASGISCCHSKLTHPSPPPLLPPPLYQSLSHLAGLRYCEHHTMKCPKAFPLASYFVLCAIYDIYAKNIAGQHWAVGKGGLICV